TAARRRVGAAERRASTAGCVRPVRLGAVWVDLVAYAIARRRGGIVLIVFIREALVTVVLIQVVVVAIVVRERHYLLPSSRRGKRSVWRRNAPETSIPHRTARNEKRLERMF